MGKGKGKGEDGPKIRPGFGPQGVNPSNILGKKQMQPQGQPGQMPGSQLSTIIAQLQMNQNQLNRNGVTTLNAIAIMLETLKAKNILTTEELDAMANKIVAENKRILIPEIPQPKPIMPPKPEVKVLDAPPEAKAKGCSKGVCGCEQMTNDEVAGSMAAIQTIDAEITRKAAEEQKPC